MTDDATITISYDIAREIVHSAKRLGAPLKPEIITSETVMVAIGWITGRADAALKADQMGEVMTEGLRQLMGRMGGDDD
jgi:hypothetical protein